MTHLGISPPKEAKTAERQSLSRVRGLPAPRIGRVQNEDTENRLSAACHLKVLAQVFIR